MHELIVKVMLECTWDSRACMALVVLLITSLYSADASGMHMQVLLADGGVLRCEVSAHGDSSVSTGHEAMEE